MHCNLNKSFIHSMCSETNFEKYKGQEENRVDAPSPIDDIFKDTQKEAVKSINSKRGRQCYQASFEKLFLKEHKQVFTKQFQTFIKTLEVKATGQHFCPKMQVKQPEKGSISLQLLFSSEGGLSQAQKALFSQHLQAQEKLVDFLDYITLTCPSEIALGFIEMAEGIYHSFSKSETRNMTGKQIIDWGVKMAEGQIVKQIDSFSNKCFKKCRQQSQFIRMVQVYCVTYFQNPFYEQNKQNIGSGVSDGPSLSDSDCDSDFSESLFTDKCRKRLKSEP